MIISQIEALNVPSENLIQDFQNEMGYSFEIKAEKDLELEKAPILDRKMIDEVKEEILEEVKLAICYACEVKEAKPVKLKVAKGKIAEAQSLKPYLKVAKGKIAEAQPLKPYLKVAKGKIAEAQILSPFIVTKGEAVEAEPIKVAAEIRLPLKYRMMKRMYHRLNKFVDKLTAKYERLNNVVDDGVKNLKPLKIINRLLDRINAVQEHFINRLEYIEKSTGRDITVFDGALDKIQDLEDKLEHMQKEIVSSLRSGKLELPKRHIMRMDDNGVISCGF